MALPPHHEPPDRKVVADEAIPFAREAFGCLGHVHLLPGRAITRDDLMDADYLFTRTVTKVNANLLKGTRVRFVGSATAGIDHVDEVWLREAGIEFHEAGGCNAKAVAQYVVAALVHTAVRRNLTLKGKTLGVVGVGHVGTHVVEYGRVLGMRVLENDPPLQKKSGDSRFVPLEQILEESDVVTCHVPLTSGGDHPTRHLIGASELEAMKSSALLFNTSRGPVVDNAALLNALRAGAIAGAVLDVWEGEPVFNPDLLRAVDIGNVHIAGYSYQAKARSVKMVMDPACEFAGVKPLWDAAREIESKRGEEFRWTPTANTSVEASLHALIQGVHDLAAEDAALREGLDLSDDERAAHFDKLRNGYVYRNEFANARVALIQTHGEHEVLGIARGLGFEFGETYFRE